ncbi:hypothetical protein [Snuella lapsa]|uniref:Ubiquitin-like domain-containing protein n=1 Tax=Snuella lapsa TaxID=870481 RepID=A0ABP6X377_9FLAO
MKQLEVLVITKNKEVPRIMNWKVSAADTVEKAIERLQLQPFKVVAILSSADEIDKKKLKQIASVLYDTMMVSEYDDDTNLSERVKAAYWSKKWPIRQNSYLDNAFDLELAYRLN